MKSKERKSIKDYVVERLKYNISKDITEIDLGYDMEKIFEFSLESLKKPQKDRKEEDNNLILCLFSFLKKFVDSLKKSYKNKLNDILTSIANGLQYTQFHGNRLIMKNGDEGKLFFIILMGTVDVLIVQKERISLTKKEYLRYLALLLLYQEYDFLKQCLDANYTLFAVKLKDVDYSNSLVSRIRKNRRRSNSSVDSVDYDVNIDIDKSSNDFFKIEPDGKGEYILTMSKLLSLLGKGTIDKYIANKKLDMKKEVDNGINLSPQEYIDRLKRYKTSYYRENKIDEPYVYFDASKFGYIGMYSKILDETERFSIMSYTIICKLGQGATFGEVALINKNSKRTATIISETDCHFGILNKINYDASIKFSIEAQRKERIKFITSTIIFRDFPIQILQSRFMNSFVDKKITKGEYLLRKGDKLDKIKLIRTGEFEIQLFESLNGLYKLIFRYFDNHVKNLAPHNFELDPNYNFYMDVKKKIIKDLGNILKEESLLGLIYKIKKKLNNEYKNPQIIRLNIVSTTDEIGLDALADENQNSLFDVICNSKEGEYLEIHKDFYVREVFTSFKDIKILVENSNYIKKIMILERFIDLRYQRLTNILKCTKSNLLEALNKVNYYDELNIQDFEPKNEHVIQSFSRPCSSLKNLYLYRNNKKIKRTNSNKSLPKQNNNIDDSLTNMTLSAMNIKKRTINNNYNKSANLISSAHSKITSAHSQLSVTKSCSTSLFSNNLLTRRKNESDNKNSDDLKTIKKEETKRLRSATIHNYGEQTNKTSKYNSIKKNCNRTNYQSNNNIFSYKNNNNYIKSEFKKLDKLIKKHSSRNNKLSGRFKITSEFRTSNSAYSLAVKQHKNLNKELNKDFLPITDQKYLKNNNYKQHDVNILMEIKDYASDVNLINNNNLLTQNKNFNSKVSIFDYPKSITNNSIIQANKNASRKICFSPNFYDANIPFKNEKTKYDYKNRQIESYIKLRNFDAIKKSRDLYTRFYGEFHLKLKFPKNKDRDNILNIKKYKSQNHFCSDYQTLI